MIGPAPLDTSGSSRQRIKPFPAGDAPAEARSGATASEQCVARDAVFAETSDGGTESLRRRLAWSYELVKLYGPKPSGSDADANARRVDALLAAGIM